MSQILIGFTFVYRVIQNKYFELYFVREFILSKKLAIHISPVLFSYTMIQDPNLESNKSNPRLDQRES